QTGRRVDPLPVPPGVTFVGPGLPAFRINAAAAAITTDLLGAEASARCALLCGKNYRLDVLAGYRFLKLDESLAEAVELVRGGLVAGRAVTSNQFHGGQFGLAGEYRSGRAYLDVAGKLGFGAVRETLELQPIGRRRCATDLAVLPETTVALGLQMTD